MNKKVTRYSRGWLSVSDATSITNTIHIIIDIIIKIGASYWNCTNRRVLTKNLFRSQNLRGIIKWWFRSDSNRRPSPYERAALTNCATEP